MEITDVLRAMCHAHRLPLALTWIPCSYIDGADDKRVALLAKKTSMSSNEKYILCIEETACYVNDVTIQGFVHACSEHHLEEGQGIVGKALQSNIPFFFPDVKEYDISEYPLVHHARKFGLNAAVAIRLKSTNTGIDDYILEFFLPVNMRGASEQQLLLDNLSCTMQRICKTLRTVLDSELVGVGRSDVIGSEKESILIFPPIPRENSQKLSDSDINFVETMPLNASGKNNGDIEREIPCGEVMFSLFLF